MKVFERTRKMMKVTSLLFFVTCWQWGSHVKVSQYYHYWKEMETNLVQMTKDRHCSCRQTLVLT